MSLRRVVKLLDRAEQMLRDAENDLDNGFPDLALFHVEQALQLSLKALLAAYMGSYPREDRLRRLLALAREATRDDYYAEVAGLRKDLLRLLETAYTEARYGGEYFEEEDAREALELARELLARIRKSIRAGVNGNGNQQ